MSAPTIAIQDWSDRREGEACDYWAACDNALCSHAYGTGYSADLPSGSAALVSIATMRMTPGNPAHTAMRALGPNSTQLWTKLMQSTFTLITTTAFVFGDAVTRP
jgi:hypothetical protein